MFRICQIGISDYKISQYSLGFNIPIVTKDFYNSDSTKISNIHFLLTGSYTRVNLNFGGIADHRLAKTAIGFRALYNNGKKSIFFVELSPFVTKDIGHSYTRTNRLAFTVLYNYAANEYVNLRLGFSRSFLWGNRFNMPYVGVRIGKLDKINVSIQFPRSVTLTIPIGKYIRTSLYSKPQGGLFAFANTDSLKIGDINNNDKLFFGRKEFLTGLRIDVLPSKKMNFYISSGFTTSNVISFTAPVTARNNASPYKDYYRQKIEPSVFVNFGFVFRFGKTKSIYNNYQLYNAIDMNNSIDNGDNNVTTGNGNIPILPKKIKINNTNEVLDLIETQDLY